MIPLCHCEEQRSSDEAISFFHSSYQLEVSRDCHSASGGSQ